jgi:hypothetical protein
VSVASVRLVPGRATECQKLRHLTEEEVDRLLPEVDRALVVRSNLAVYHCLVEEIARLEAVVKEQLKLKRAYPASLSPLADLSCQILP